MLRLLLFAVIVNCQLSIVNCKAQSLSLDEAISHAQDSTIIAFQSRQEYNYHTLHYDEFLALRKPQLNLRVAPNYYRLLSDLSRDYVYLRNYDNLSAAASVTLSQKMLNWGGEAYIGSQASGANTSVQSPMRLGSSWQHPSWWATGRRFSATIPTAGRKPSRTSG